MPEEKIKEAFQKVKDDIQSLKSQIQELKRTLDTELDKQTNRQTLRQIIPTENFPNATQTQNTTHIPTQNQPLEASKTQISSISTGNEGVSTDRQTDKQTDTSTGNEGVKVRLNQIVQQKTNKIEHLQKVAEIINSLDDIKKELRQKIKKLTNQEMTVLTSIYQLEEKGFIVDYSLLSEALELTESSIRDYIQRIIKKGLPIEKTKENNKKITLHISQNLKKIAPLTTIIELRDL